MVKSTLEKDPPSELDILSRPNLDSLGLSSLGLGALGLDDVQLEASETLCKSFFSLHRLHLRHASQHRFEETKTTQSGGTLSITREVMHRGAASAVLPYDPDTDKVILIEQFRVGAFMAGLPPWQLEIVAGMIEEKESPAAVACRESIEETGLPVLDLIPIYIYFPSSGGCSEYIHLFLGRVKAPDMGRVCGLITEGEETRTYPMPLVDASTLLANGLIRDAQAIIALQWLFLNRDAVRKRWCDFSPMTDADPCTKNRRNSGRVRRSKRG